MLFYDIKRNELMYKTAPNGFEDDANNMYMCHMHANFINFTFLLLYFNLLINWLLSVFVVFFWFFFFLSLM
ncbi:hypothetical protein MIMGU_mgv1a017501mg [Erythranthe guttata]|uniref:Uncharacterized protein n=1 Tax=Erythranthe guttata TaxID=4155 RepID=A0A022RQZ2_ERYGU|nr:hypothetical protein MIMGU_mgv1a017501mg [Erythranthe guttata]